MLAAFAEVAVRALVSVSSHSAGMERASLASSDSVRPAVRVFACVCVFACLYEVCICVDTQYTVFSVGEQQRDVSIPLQIRERVRERYEKLRGQSCSLFAIMDCLLQRSTATSGAASR